MSTTANLSHIEVVCLSMYKLTCVCISYSATTGMMVRTLSSLFLSLSRLPSLFLGLFSVDSLSLSHTHTPQHTPHLMRWLPESATRTLLSPSTTTTAEALLSPPSRHRRHPPKQTVIAYKQLRHRHPDAIVAAVRHNQVAVWIHRQPPWLVEAG